MSKLLDIMSVQKADDNVCVSVFQCGSEEQGTSLCESDRTSGETTDPLLEEVRDTPWLVVYTHTYTHTL